MANQITKTHADWLSLIEISGPFVSMPILAEVFPQGLEDVSPESVGHVCNVTNGNIN